MIRTPLYIPVRNTELKLIYSYAVFDILYIFVNTEPAVLFE